MATVQFPDGTTVEAVGIQERRPDKPGRDYGFCAGRVCVATLVTL